MKKIGIYLVHHTESNRWFQYVSQCTFYSKTAAYSYDLTRVSIEESETKRLFEELDMKPYLTYEGLVYYGCSNIRKVNDVRLKCLENLKNRSECKPALDATTNIK